MSETNLLKGMGHNQRVIAQADLGKRWWSAQELSAHLGLVAHQVTMSMRTLVRRDLFERRRDGEQNKAPYQYRQKRRA